MPSWRSTRPTPATGVIETSPLRSSVLRSSGRLLLRNAIVAPVTWFRSGPCVRVDYGSSIANMMVCRTSPPGQAADGSTDQRSANSALARPGSGSSARPASSFCAWAMRARRSARSLTPLASRCLRWSWALAPSRSYCTRRSRSRSEATPTRFLCSNATGPGTQRTQDRSRIFSRSWPQSSLRLRNDPQGWSSLRSRPPTWMSQCADSRTSSAPNGPKPPPGSSTA